MIATVDVKSVGEKTVPAPLASKTFQGRVWSVLENYAVIDFIKAVTPSDSVTAFGEFAGYSIKALTHSKTTHDLSAFQTTVDHFLVWSFAFGLPGHILYFLREESKTPGNSFIQDYRKGDCLNIAKNVVICAVDMAALFDLWATANLVDLGKLANNVGNTTLLGKPVLAFVADASLEKFFNESLLLLNALSLVQTIRDKSVYISKGTDDLDLQLNPEFVLGTAKTTSEIALRIYLLYFGSSLTNTHVILGLIAKGTGFVAEFYPQIGSSKESR
jgi:hypothetical protein